MRGAGVVMGIEEYLKHVFEAVYKAYGGKTNFMLADFCHLRYLFEKIWAINIDAHKKVVGM